MSQNFRRIALFCDSLEPSGVGRVMETLGRELHARGFAVFLVCDEGAGADGLWARLAPHIRDGARLRLRSPEDASARAALVQQLRDWKIELFHNHIGILWEGNEGTRAAREAGVALVVSTEHLPAFPVWAPRFPARRRQNREVDAIFAVSRSVARSHREMGLALADQLEVVENGVDAFNVHLTQSNPERSGVRAELNGAEGVPLVLFCGRLVEQKDPYALLDGFALCARSDAHLLVVGDGPLRAHCENRARERNIENRVHFLGHRSDLARLLAASDVFVLPSKFEGLPLSALEAMAARLPIVACNAPGTRDCVWHEHNGFLAPLGDARALALGLERALGEDGKRWGENGHALFCERFQTEQFAERQIAAYHCAWTKRGQSKPKRIVWVFAWLVVGGEETEVRLLARHLDPTTFAVEVVACFRKEGMPLQSHIQLEEAGVVVDCAPYWMSFEETVAYLSHRLEGADVVIVSQNAPDVFPALEKIAARGGRVPPLIEHGGIVSEARGPKRFTSRFLGVCNSIRDAARELMPGRENHALALHSMVDLDEFNPTQRDEVRRELGFAQQHFVVGWVGRLDRKKRVEDFVRAAALLGRARPNARFVVVGGPDAFMPEYERELHDLAVNLNLTQSLQFLGDRDDVPRLLCAFDALCWLSRGEGMPHVISEAGAARLPVVATRDGGSTEQIEDGFSGLFVGHQAPDEVAACLVRLMDDAVLRARLGDNLRAKVERDFGANAVARKWEAVFEEVWEERKTSGDA